MGTRATPRDKLAHTLDHPAPAYWSPLRSRGQLPTQAEAATYFLLSPRWRSRARALVAL